MSDDDSNASASTFRSPAEVYFGRIDRNWPIEHRQQLWEKGLFGVMFDNAGGVDRAALRAAFTSQRGRYREGSVLGYSGTIAAIPTLNRLLDAIDGGAIIFADFRGIATRDREADVMVGVASGSGIIIEEIRGSRYKCVQLTNVKRVRQDPVLAALRPQQSTFTAWPVATPRVKALHSGEKLPPTVQSLTPGQLEALCYEYLRLRLPALRLLLPVGRTLPDVDIYGWLPDGPLVAQVTHSGSGAGVVLSKARVLAGVVPTASARVLFAGQVPIARAKATGALSQTVETVAIEEVFRELSSSQPALVASMLRASE